MLTFLQSVKFFEITPQTNLFVLQIMTLFIEGGLMEMGENGLLHAKRTVSSKKSTGLMKVQIEFHRNLGGMLLERSLQIFQCL